MGQRERRPQGSPCVDIVFGYFERCYLRQEGGDGPINHRVIETEPVIIHLGPFDKSQRQIFFLPSRFFFFFLDRLPTNTHGLAFQRSTVRLEASGIFMI